MDTSTRRTDPDGCRKTGHAAHLSRCAAACGALLLALTAWGCGPERPSTVPADARSVAKQSGSNPITFTAPEDGTAFLYNRSTSKMIYSGRLKRGDTIEVDPKRNEIRVDGRTALQPELRDLNEYQMWFDPEAHPGSRIDVKTGEAK
jgi:hypothetical protein